MAFPSNLASWLKKNSVIIAVALAMALCFVLLAGESQGTKIDTFTIMTEYSGWPFAWEMTQAKYNVAAGSSLVAQHHAHYYIALALDIGIAFSFSIVLIKIGSGWRRKGFKAVRVSLAKRVGLVALLIMLPVLLSQQYVWAGFIFVPKKLLGAAQMGREATIENAEQFLAPQRNVYNCNDQFAIRMQYGYPNVVEKDGSSSSLRIVDDAIEYEGTDDARNKRIKLDDLVACKNSLGQNPLGIILLHSAAPDTKPELMILGNRRAAEQGDAKAQALVGQGYMLLVEKSGAKQNYVDAYMWYALAAAKGNAYSARIIPYITPQMTPAQITEAQKRVADWKPGSP